MPTQKTFTSDTPGPILVDITSHTGLVNVTVDSAVKYAEVRVSTPDDEGSAADAVRDTLHRTHSTPPTLKIDVPKTPGNATYVGGGVLFNSMNRGSVVTQNAGSSTVIGNGNVWLNGQQVVRNGVVVAESGTVVSGPGASGQILVDVRVPEHSQIKLRTTSADLDVAGDILRSLDVQSTSGDVRVRAVQALCGQLTSGDIRADLVYGEVDINTVSGDVEVGAYSGSELFIHAVSGDISVRAYPAATGRFKVSTVSGDITERGARLLNPRLNTVSGKVHRS